VVATGKGLQIQQARALAQDRDYCLQHLIPGAGRIWVSGIALEANQIEIGCGINALGHWRKST